MHIQRLIAANPGQALLLLGMAVSAVVTFVVFLRRALRSNKDVADQVGRKPGKGPPKRPKSRKRGR